jgi:hypothetical protein
MPKRKIKGPGRGLPKYFGKEKTKRQCLQRAKWEIAAAKQALSQPFGDIIAPMHLRTAKAYHELSKEKP